MPRTQKLTAKAVAHAAHDGTTRAAQRIFDGDGSGLALNVKPGGTKSWVQSITVRGRRRTFGLGPYPMISLREAREAALRNKRIAFEGGDPVAERNERRGAPLFRELAERVIAAREGEWVSPRTAPNWRSSLAAYARPLLAQRIDQITVADVMACLTPIWSDKRETATRVKRRIGAVMEWSVAHGYRTDDPVRAAASLLPKRRAKAVHHKALPWAEVPGAVRTIRGTGAWPGTRLAFEFLVLTAARSGEVRGATWDEVDVDAALWTIPGTRMKAGVAHRVPLAPAALAVLAEARLLTDPPITPAHRGCTLVFPSVQGKALSDSTISKLLRENCVAGVPHGFRSSFRDWAAETTGAPHAVMEAALAHAVPSAVERAYARTDLLDQRRSLMDAWGRFVADPS